jgi:hypothetical protein
MVRFKFYFIKNQVFRNEVCKHVPFGKQNYYLNYDSFYDGVYFRSGYNNPFSLY